MATLDEAPRVLHEVVADRIRNAILSGDLQPGQRLVEDRLARELDVSRHPVREALRTLQLEGLVDISPRRGATVSTVSVEEAGELYEVLAALDGLAARLAAEVCDDHGPPGATQVLDDAAAIITGATQGFPPADLEILARLNREFHVLIGRAGHNHQLIDTITPLRDRIQWIHATVARRRPERSWAEHRAIHQAIMSHDADLAETLARAHIDAARTLYLEDASQNAAARR